jgi:EAL domain-containing protein (putative c-di-GMP-specific phosphodiesterase class I)/GGDEF domain-containing protein
MMLESVKEERSRHFQLALRVGIPVMILVLTISYAIFFYEDNITITAQSAVLMTALIFVVVYFIYFALEQSRKESVLDPVTEGYRFDYFLKYVQKKKPGTLAAIRVRNLSTLNENYGIKTTDKLLQDLIVMLNEYLSLEGSKKVAIGRKYGTEFLIAIDIPPERMKKLLASFVERHASIGTLELEYVYTVVRNDSDDPLQAIEQLRNLLNVPQKCTSPDENGNIPDVKGLTREESMVLEALKGENILLLFRPLKNIRNDKIDIYEISVKLRGFDGKIINPRQFLPIVNRHNFGEYYDLLLYRKVLKTLALVDEDISFSFNLSPFSLRSASFNEKLVDELLQSGVSAERIIIELYEKKTHHRMENYLDLLKNLKKYGLRFCLDNFGSSNASMEYIKHFHFDMVQFDRDYISNMEEEKSFSIFKSLVSMVHELEITAIAKWVDDRKKIDRLERLGIDYVQGYAIGSVLDEDELIERYNPIPKESV